MRNNYSWSLASAIILIAFSEKGAAQESNLDYPQWRGQQRDGSASAFTAPKIWPDQLTRKWKIEVGEGYATPLVVGNTVTFSAVALATK